MEASVKFKTQQRTLARLGEEAARIAIEDGRDEDAVNILKEARRRYQQVDDWDGFNRAHTAICLLAKLSVSEAYLMAQGVRRGELVPR